MEVFHFMSGRQGAKLVIFMDKYLNIFLGGKVPFQKKPKKDSKELDEVDLTYLIDFLTSVG